MSAIFGIIDFFSNPIEKDWTSSMQADLLHRGPDGLNSFVAPGIVLGHMLFRVTPESVYDTGIYQENGLIITANARLDERVELMKKLKIDPSLFNTVTDSILLLRSYQRWGKDFVKDIYGDFSFAIWDTNTKELFCGRDQVGVKPFFYYIDENGFIFSTELRSIVNLPVVQTMLDQHYLRNRAIAICDQPACSAWTNILRLEAAHTLSLLGTDLRLTRYWQPRYKRNKAFKTVEQSAGAVRILLQKIIADHTRVEGNVGASLSGGLDSGTIACLAARELAGKGKSLVTASSVYTPGKENSESPDEKPFIEAVINQENNIIPTFVEHADHSFLNSLPEKFRRNYAPVNVFHYVDEAIYCRFQEKQVRRVLSGYLGDLSVTNSSINPFPILLTTGRILAFRKLAREFSQHSTQPFKAFFKYSIFREFLPTWFQQKWNRLKGRPGEGRDVSALPLKFQPGEKKTLQAKVEQTFRFRNRRPGDIVGHVWPKDIYLFDEEEDCAAAHHQLEVTYPFCDRRLIELVLQLPVEHFYARGKKRGLIREAMAGILPEMVRTRTTKGSYAPGYTHLIKREVNQIIKIFNEERLAPGVGSMADIEKLKSALKNLSESEIEDSFTYPNWSLIEIVIWLLCSREMEKRKK